MKDKFATYEISKMLKEIGFKEESIAYYWANKDTFHWTIPPYRNHNEIPTRISAPLWQQVEEWLYKNHGYIFDIFGNKDRGEFFVWVHTKKEMNEFSTEDNKQPSPQLARIEGIKKSVEYLYNKIKK